MIRDDQAVEPVPGLPYARPSAWFADAATTLRSGLPVWLVPSRGPSGHLLSTQHRRGRRRADAALEARIGIAPLYVSTFDYDWRDAGL